jgi:hypothetical protein
MSVEGQASPHACRRDVDRASFVIDRRAGRGRISVKLRLRNYEVGRCAVLQTDKKLFGDTFSLHLHGRVP